MSVAHHHILHAKELAKKHNTAHLTQKPPQNVFVKWFKRVSLFSLFLLLVISRFYGLDWGMPYLMHPDENNMTYAIARLSCTGLNLECFNPQFFAYGQLQLYFAYGALFVVRLLLPFVEFTGQNIAISLRTISAVASILTGIAFYRLIRREMSSLFALVGLGFFVGTPLLIQQAHFGTTESLLTMFLVFALTSESLFGQALWVGLAAATKPSGLMFAIVPYSYVMLLKTDRHTIFLNMFRLLMAFIFVAAIAVLFSPHHVIHYKDFLGSFAYESSVATGSLSVFYTQQFIGTLPIVFQFTHILPLGLGPLVLILSLIGIVYALFSKKRHMYYYLFVFVVLFGANAYLYSKWSRFIAPTIPLFLFFAAYALFRTFQLVKPIRTYIYYFLTVVVFLQLVWGYMFFSIYMRPDVRVVASKWIVENISQETRVLAESANVVDLPLDHTSAYDYASIFLNDIDQNPERRAAFETALPLAQYIIVPSRRVFMNYTCYREFGNEMKKEMSKTCFENERKYPRINAYYDELFASGKYELVQKFTSYPKLEIAGNTLFELPDEKAEETWSVFDHPVVRVYKKK